MVPFRVRVLWGKQLDRVDAITFTATLNTSLSLRFHWWYSLGLPCVSYCVGVIWCSMVVLGSSPGGQHNEGDVTPVSGSAPLGSKKSSGGGGFLRSLLCCWRGGRGKGPPGSNGANSIDGRASPLPQERGLLVMDHTAPRPLLPPVKHQDMHKKCMVIDLDETLVHSSFKVCAHVLFKIFLLFIFCKLC